MLIVILFLYYITSAFGDRYPAFLTDEDLKSGGLLHHKRNPNGHIHAEKQPSTVTHRTPPRPIPPTGYGKPKYRPRMIKIGADGRQRDGYKDYDVVDEVAQSYGVKDKEDEEAAGQEDNFMYDIIDKMKAAGKFDEWVEETDKQKEKYKGTVLRNWEKDAHRWEMWAKNVIQKKKPPSRSWSLSKFRAPKEEGPRNPSAGLEAYWSDVPATPTPQKKEENIMPPKEMMATALQKLKDFQEHGEQPEKKVEVTTTAPLEPKTYKPFQQFPYESLQQLPGIEQPQQWGQQQYAGRQLQQQAWGRQQPQAYGQQPQALGQQQSQAYGQQPQAWGHQQLQAYGQQPQSWGHQEPPAYGQQPQALRQQQPQAYGQQSQSWGQQQPQAYGQQPQAWGQQQPPAYGLQQARVQQQAWAQQPQAWGQQEQALGMQEQALAQQQLKQMQSSLGSLSGRSPEIDLLGQADQLINQDQSQGPVVPNYDDILHPAAKESKKEPTTEPTTEPQPDPDTETKRDPMLSNAFLESFGGQVPKGYLKQRKKLKEKAKQMVANNYQLIPGLSTVQRAEKPKNKTEQTELPQFDDFSSPIRWVQFSSSDTKDGLAKVTDPFTGKNREFIINGSVLVPIPDHDLSRIGLTTMKPVTVGPSLLYVTENILRTVLRSVDVDDVEDSDWLAYETAMGGREESDQCRGEACQSRCTKMGCETMCKGDTCASGCVGGMCNAHCKGPGCFAMCIGESCIAKCDGTNCDARCRGKDCEAQCSSFSCYQTKNGILRRGRNSWNDHYQQI